MVGIFPLIDDIKVDIAKTESSHVAQLLSPVGCSLLVGEIVRVQDPK